MTSSEFKHPPPDRFIRYFQSVLSQQILDIAKAQREAAIEPYGILDDLGWEAMAAIRNGFHRSKPARPRSNNKPIYVTKPSRFAKATQRTRRRQPRGPLSAALEQTAERQKEDAETHQEIAGEVQNPGPSAEAQRTEQGGEPAQHRQGNRQAAQDLRPVHDQAAAAAAAPSNSRRPRPPWRR